MSNLRTILNAEDHSIANLPIHIMDKILKKLPGRDLINMLAVSKTFNETIASSETYMYKIRLNAHSDKARVSVLQHSNRKYQHVSIDDHSGYNDDFLLSTKFQWKTIKVKDMILTKDIRIFISTYASTLESLEYLQVYLDDNEYENPYCHLPKLKTIIINGQDCDSAYIYLALMRGRTPSVEELTIPQNALIHIFDANLVFTPHIKKLHLVSPSIHRLWDVRNSLLFFQDTLEELTVEMINKEATEFIWNEMPYLKKVTLRANNSMFMVSKPLDLNNNNNIRELIVHNNKVPFDIYEDIVKASPKLSLLEIHHYKKDHLKQTSGTKYSGVEMRRALWEKYAN